MNIDHDEIVSQFCAMTRTRPDEVCLALAPVDDDHR